MMVQDNRLRLIVGEASGNEPDIPCDPDEALDYLCTEVIGGKKEQENLEYQDRQAD